MFKISKKQQAIYNAWKNTDSNILVEAVAGGSKTTVLMGILERSKFKTLFLAFNKSIQQEIEKRITEKGFTHGKSMTLHSLGLLAIRNNYDKVEIVNNKNFEMILQFQKKTKHFSKLSWEDKTKLSYCLMDMNDISRLFLTEDIEIIKHHMLEMDKTFVENDKLEIIFKDFIEFRNKFTFDFVKVRVDFIDMLYIPVMKNLKIPINPIYLLVDECQDLSILQHRLIENLISQGDIKKWIFVGDRRQSIYSFMGAYSSSFDLIEQKENTIKLPLDVCYRCPSLIINEANKVYNVMLGFKEDRGVVKKLLDNSYNSIPDRAMVICRSNVPLIKLYFDLLSCNRKVVLKGEDILGSLLKFLKPFKYKTILNVIEHLTSEIQRLKNESPFLAEENQVTCDKKVFNLENHLQNILVLSQLFLGSERTVDNFSKFLESLISKSDDKDAIILCTIHKSKGLEADIVVILNEFLIPIKYAKSDVQKEQEKNLKYVARTRAKKEMYYLDIKKYDENEKKEKKNYY